MHEYRAVSAATALTGNLIVGFYGEPILSAAGLK
jgi:hypothetical protein